jgi:hypothetical protein
VGDDPTFFKGLCVRTSHVMKMVYAGKNEATSGTARLAT